MLVNKEEKVKRKKKIIINALKRRLEVNVYSKITVQDIADEAGFSKGGILHYFHTKEDIYLELIEDIFTEFEEAHSSILEWNYNSNEIAPISALVGAENFILEKTNIKILTNLILYAFEDEKIKNILSKFIVKHRNFYNNIIDNVRKDNPEKNTGIETKYLSRIAQSIVFFIGLIELLDPIEIDHIEIVKFVTKLLKG